MRDRQFLQSCRCYAVLRSVRPLWGLLQSAKRVHHPATRSYGRGKVCALSFAPCYLRDSYDICRGIHNSDSGVRSRVFYLLYKFLKEDRNEISPEVAETLLNGIRDVLPIQVELPEVEGPDVDILAEAVNTSTIFDHQLYLFESAGILISLTFKTPEKSETLLLSVVDPLLEELSRCLQAVKGPQDVLPIVKVHHIIMALGNVAKGFPETPSPVPETYILPPIAVFRRMAQAIIFSLEAMNVFKIVRDAVCATFC